MDIMSIAPSPADLNSALADAKLAAAKGRAKATPHNEKELRQTAQDFEAVFISQLMQPMMESVETNELTGGGHAEGIFRSMMVTEVGKGMAANGGIGIAENVYRELLKLQEGN